MDLDTETGSAATVSLAVCDVEPDLFRVFTFAVLSLHTERAVPGVSSRCSCGEQWTDCIYAQLAQALLLCPLRDGQPDDRTLTTGLWQ